MRWTARLSTVATPPPESVGEMRSREGLRTDTSRAHCAAGELLDFRAFSDFYIFVVTDDL